MGHRWNDQSDFEWLNYSKTSRFISTISTNLSYLDLQHDEYLTRQYGKEKSLLGFFSNNRIEWLLLEIACMSTHIVTVGLFSNIGKLPEFAEKLQLKYLFCPAEYLEKVIELQKNQQISIKIAIVVDLISPELLQACAEVKIKIIGFEELTNGEIRNEREIIDSNDPYCISITSGTTGPVKFSIISHLNLMSNLCSGLYLSSSISTEDSYLSYLNYSLLGEKVFIFMISASGGKVGIARDPVDFKKDIRYLKPTFMITVPRMLEFMYKNIKNSVDNLTGVSKSLYTKAYSSKLKSYEKTGNLKHKVWDAIVFKKAKKLMGGNLKVLVVGSGMCNKDTIKYLRVVLGCYILEGYGLVEGTSMSLCTVPSDTNTGHVGGPLMNLEIRLKYTGHILEDYNNYYGELCIRGQSVSTRYYLDSESTLDSSGWLHTGDVFALVPETGALKFIDRLEYLAKSLTGKSICLQKLELIYRQCSFVAQILIVPDQRIEGIIAIVVPDKAFVESKWKENDFDRIFKSSDFLAGLLREFLVLERIYKLKPFEKILKVHIESEPWVSAELITPTLKPKRNKILKKYTGEIEGLVQEILTSS